MIFMARCYLLFSLFISFLSPKAADNNFYISKTYFSGERIKLFSQNRGGAVALLDDHRMFLMSRQFVFSEITSNISQEILDDITSIECIDENSFIIGTLSHSAFLFENGTLISLQDLNPDLPDTITSIDYSAMPGNDEYQVLIATNRNVFGSANLKSYLPYPYTNYDSIVFFDNRHYALLGNYDRCGSTPGRYGAVFTYSTGVALYKIFEDDTYNFTRLNDLIPARQGGNSSYQSYALYATDRGIYTQWIYNCSPEVARHLADVEAHDLETVASGLPKTTILAATDEGLLVWEKESGISNPTYYALDGIDKAYDVTYSRFHNIIWVSTNDGIKVIQEDNLTRESFEPGKNEFDTVTFCQENGAWLYVDLNDQLGIQWYRNNEKIDGAIAKVLRTFEPGHYSVAYNEMGETTELDMAYVKRDSTFDESLTTPDQIICPDEFGVTLVIEEFTTDHNYKWYSVENGLERDAGNDSYYFQAQKEGNYFFTATNCNDYVYYSDTVEILESKLQQPSFDEESMASDLCEGDTLHLEDIQHAKTFKWIADYEIVENYNQPFFIVSDDLSQDALSVVVTDEYGCEHMRTIRLNQVLETPSLKSGAFYYVCDSLDYVYLEVPFGSRPVWDGMLDDTPQKVRPGVYSVTVTNDVCSDFTSNINVIYYDPLPFSDTLIYVLIGDSLKIRQSSGFPDYWSQHWQYDWINDLLFITSNIPTEMQTSLSYYQAGCGKDYNVTIRFVTEILSAEPLAYLNIYPNPASEVIYIDPGDMGLERIELIDIFGKPVYQVANPKGAIRIALAPHIQPGLYFVKITRENGQARFKKLLVK